MSSEQEQGYLCSLCKGLGVTPWPVEEIRGWVDGPQFLTSTIVVHATGFAGHGALQPPETFSQQLELREYQQLSEWPDDLLIEHITRLRRKLVMLTDAQTAEWWAVSLRRRYDQAERELSWRKRASEKGAPSLNRTERWNQRIEAVKDNTDLALLIAFENEQARPKGTEGWTCCCPFHRDKNPSLDIDTKKNVWYCHVCAIGGDALTYIQMKYGYSFYEAVLHLEERLGIGKGKQ